MAKANAKALKKEIKNRKAKIAKQEGKVKKLKKQLKKAKQSRGIDQPDRTCSSGCFYSVLKPGKITFMNLTLFFKK